MFPVAPIPKYFVVIKIVAVNATDIDRAELNSAEETAFLIFSNLLKIIKIKLPIVKLNMRKNSPYVPIECNTIKKNVIIGSRDVFESTE